MNKSIQKFYFRKNLDRYKKNTENQTNNSNCKITQTLTLTVLNQEIMKVDHRKEGRGDSPVPPSPTMTSLKLG